jgi:hypothetical protein
LILYLLQNIQLDFQGDISLDKVRAFLREDDTREARRLLGKLIDDQSVEPMLITLADCLNEYIDKGIDSETVSEQLRLYAES